MLFSSLVVNALSSCAPNRRVFQAESKCFYIPQLVVILQISIPSDGWNTSCHKFANDSELLAGVT
jgi:hypothetical protein